MLSTVLETPHVAVGAAIAVKVANPYLALPLSFASHFLLEKVPHWNPHLNTELNKHGKITSSSMKLVIADSTTALVFGSLVASSFYPDYNRMIVVLLACFFAALPDLIEAPYYMLNMPSKFIEKRWIPFKKSLQADTSRLPGLATQFVTFLAAAYWIFG